MAGKKGMKGGGGRRPGAGRKRKPETLAMIAELDRHRDLAVPDVLPSVFLKRVMNDESAPLAARIMSARSVIQFIERKPEPAPPGEIPLMREWTNEQLESFERRTREDMTRDPGYYGREALEQMGL